MPTSHTASESPFDPIVDVTVRGVTALEPVVRQVRETALRLTRRTGEGGPYIVTVDQLPSGRVFVTVRLGRDAVRPEWGLTGPDVASAVQGAFGLLGSDLRSPPAAAAAG